MTLGVLAVAVACVAVPCTAMAAPAEEQSASYGTTSMPAPHGIGVSEVVGFLFPAGSSPALGLVLGLGLSVLFYSLGSNLIAGGARESTRHVPAGGRVRGSWIYRFRANRGRVALASAGAPGDYLSSEKRSPRP